MIKYRVLLLMILLTTTLFSKEEIFISPKIALKMVNKNNVLFVSLDKSNLLIKRGKKLNHKFLNNFELLGDLPCKNFYICPNELESYLSKIGIQQNDRLIIHDDSYGIYSSVLYTILESIGHKNIAILRGNIKEILDLDPNWEGYKRYVHEMKNTELLRNKDLNQTDKELYVEKLKSLQTKIELLKPHLLVQLNDESHQQDEQSTYKIQKLNRDYLHSKEEFATVLKASILNENNVSMIDVCGLGENLLGEEHHSNSHFKSLSWKSLIDKEKNYLKSDKELEKMFNQLGLNKKGENAVYCMSGGQKAFFIMLAMRQVGFEKVKAFIGDWNIWIGDIDE